MVNEIARSHERATLELRRDQAALKSDQEALTRDREALKRDQEALKRDQEALKRDQEAIKSDLEAIKRDQEAIKSDLETLKSDLEALNGNHEALKGEMEGLRSQLQRLQGGVDGLLHRQEEVDGLIGQDGVFKNQINALHLQMGDLKREVKNFRGRFEIELGPEAMGKIEELVKNVLERERAGERLSNCLAVERSETANISYHSPRHSPSTSPSLSRADTMLVPAPLHNSAGSPRQLGAFSSQLRLGFSPLGPGAGAGKGTP